MDLRRYGIASLIRALLIFNVPTSVASQTLNFLLLDIGQMIIQLRHAWTIDALWCLIRRLHTNITNLSVLLLCDVESDFYLIILSAVFASIYPDKLPGAATKGLRLSGRVRLLLYIRQFQGKRRRILSLWDSEWWRVQWIRGLFILFSSLLILTLGPLSQGHTFRWVLGDLLLAMFRVDLIYFNLG